MYNRYIRNDQGVYTRIQENDAHGQQDHTPPQNNPQWRQDPPRQEYRDAPQREAPQERRAPPRQDSQSPPRQEQTVPHGHRQGTSIPPQDSSGDGFSRMLRNLLNRFHLENVDTSDLLLLLLLFLLFKEEADEELLFALGLLLIL